VEDLFSLKPKLENEEPLVQEERVECKLARHKVKSQYLLSKEKMFQMNHLE